VPSKALLRAARAYADVRDAGRFGVDVPAGVRVDFPALMERMRRLRAEISPNDSVGRFQKLGVDVFLGEGRFTGADTLAVAGRTLRFARAVVATGTRPAVPPIDGLAEAGYLTNETVFELTALPARLAIIGAGPIGSELAQAFARFGAHVTLVGNRAQLLPREEPDAAALVARSLARDGVELRFENRVLHVERRGAGKVVRLEQRGERTELAVDEVLIATGRVPNVQGLGLEAAGVAFDERAGVHVDDRLRTSNRRIYAAGDICSPYKFTHAAGAMARLVVQNALLLGRRRVSRLVIPWCTYTDPELARVGLSAREAAEQGVPIQTYERPLDDVDRAILDGETEGFVRVHVRRGTARIVGATVVARHAGDLIAELSLVLTARLRLGQVGRTIHPYPTQAEAIRQTSDLYARSRLTPFVQGLLRRWFAWTR
jgi:pyruvate/2-oxoglutarate dehydrogenase complex dihydrolipoamide dehydrogenase (E3) component